MREFPFFPEQASTIAPQVDLLYWALVGLAAFFTFAVGFFIIFFIIRFYRGSNADRSGQIHESLRVEVTWAVIPFFLAMAVFGWGANIYFQMYEMPAQGLDVYVVGKQWMWKFQHPTGHREINELHVPVNTPVRLVMISEDVIHAFGVPAFRIKRDVLPGRYTTVWFEATRAGEYPLYCTEYCGTLHSEMIGRIIVLEQRTYQQWLQQRRVDHEGDVIPEGTAPVGEEPISMAQAGEQLFQSLGCIICHRMDGTGPGPSLVGAYGTPVQLTTGEVVMRDMNYIRTSILDPNAQIVAGYPAIMPTYDGQIDEEQLMQLMEYIQSLGAEDEEIIEGEE
jgi:cytochrome c oxidase subunit II